MKELKPVVFVQGSKEFYRPNYYVQNILIKALSEGITDPKELQKIASLEKVADVYRSLDKLAIRKEYHEALARNNISLDYIVENIKGLADNARREEVQLHSLQTLLRSLGLEKYERQESGGKNWEELIREVNEGKGREENDFIDGEVEYEVITPEVPNEEKEIRRKEAALGKELYEK